MLRASRGGSFSSQISSDNDREKRRSLFTLRLAFPSCSTVLCFTTVPVFPAQLPELARRPSFREETFKPELRCLMRTRGGVKTYLPGLFLLIHPLSKRRIFKQSDKRSISERIPRLLARKYQAFSLTFARSARKRLTQVNAVDFLRLKRLLRSINNLIQSALTIESQFSVPVSIPSLNFLLLFLFIFSISCSQGTIVIILILSLTRLRSFFV